MKAMVWTAYGPPEVLQLQEVAKPAPKDDQVLVRIYATTVTAGDCEMRSLKLPLGLGLPMRFYNGLSKPGRITILGQELAGDVEAVGKEVTLFREGDAVFAATGLGLSAYAEYICLHEKAEDAAIALKPANLTYDEAAAIPVGGLEALHFVRKAAIRPGETMLINGAGGSIGTIAVQLAKHFGAEVTAVDSGGKLEMLRELGAGHVIDYTQEDFTATGQRYDVILDVVGKSPFSASVGVLKRDGRYLLANPRLSAMARGRWARLPDGKKVISGTSSRSSDDLAFLSAMIEAGEITPVIDRRYSLAQMVEAHRYVETGQKQGNVVITVGQA